MIDKLRNNSLYHTFSSEEKQIYWNGRISDIYRGAYDRLPLKLFEFRKQMGVEENDFESFIPGILATSIDWSGDELSIEDLFILDEQAQRKLGLWENTNVKKNANNILNGELSISGVEVSTIELIENIGDLYYDTLAKFLLEVSKYTKENTIVTKLTETSTHIKEAWGWCERFGKNHPKHSDEIKDTNLSNDELAKEIGGLETSKLNYFIKLLGDKIEKDGNSDKERGRENLSKALFSASNTLKD